MKSLLAAMFFLVSNAIVGYLFLDDTPPELKVKQPVGEKPYTVESLCLGEFVLDSDPEAKDYKEYLDEMNIPEQYQDILRRIKTHLEFKKLSNDQYNYKVFSPLITRQIQFDLGENVPARFIDGRKFNSTFTLEGINTIIQELKFENLTTKNRFVFSDKGLVAHLSAIQKAAVRTFKRVDDLSALIVTKTESGEDIDYYYFD